MMYSCPNAARANLGERHIVAIECIARRLDARGRKMGPGLAGNSLSSDGIIDAACRRSAAAPLWQGYR
jgi:hypothetical protein